MRAEDAAREIGSSLEDIRERVERGETEGFVCDGELMVPVSFATSQRPSPAKWADEVDAWAHAAARGTGPISAVELIHEDRREREQDSWSSKP